MKHKMHGLTSDLRFDTFAFIRKLLSDLGFSNNQLVMLSFSLPAAFRISNGRVFLLFHDFLLFRFSF